MNKKIITFLNIMDVFSWVLFAALFATLISYCIKAFLLW